MTLSTNQSKSNSFRKRANSINLVDAFHRYQLFEKAHSQGNQWNEAFFEIEPTTDKFQIIFEAAGSNGLINDIAIDDVALLNGGECLQFSKSNVTEEIDGVFGTQSCANRCNETESVRTHSSTALDQNGKIIEKCDCHLECLELDTCCIDYQLKCLESKKSRIFIKLRLSFCSSFKPILISQKNCR